MKILTCNVPDPHVNAMDKLIKEKRLFPSRSELIRVAIRDFLKKYLVKEVQISPSEENS